MKGNTAEGIRHGCCRVCRYCREDLPYCHLGGELSQTVVFSLRFVAVMLYHRDFFCLKNEKIIFDTGAKIEITDAFWKSFPYVIKKDSNLDKDVLGFSVEYVEEEIPTEIKIKNVSRGTSHIIQCMATLSYPTGNITQE